MGGNYREIGRGRAAFASGRRRGCPRRPPTPPDERFRIRRLLWNMPVRKPVLRMISACRVQESRTFRILSGSAAYLPDVLWHFGRLVCSLNEPRTLGAKRFHKFGPSPASKPGEPQRCSGLLWPRLAVASCGSCSSDREFAFHFLQIPPRGGHPCGSARSSRHQGLHRNFHPASQFPVRFRSPVTASGHDAARHA